MGLTSLAIRDRQEALVLRSSEALARGESCVGGKALGLARLEALGARVPRWFVVPAGCFATHLAQGDLPDLLERERQRLARLGPLVPGPTIDLVAATLRKAVESAPLDQELTALIAIALRELGGGPFAVRSSMVGEDSAHRSFAGQLDSFLAQRDAEDVAAVLLRCWGSAFSARALSYVIRAGEALALPRMAVVVQQMIVGAVSGVAFSAHPVTGRRDHALVSAALGLCEGVVSGLANADEFVWDRAKGEVSARLADKDTQVVAASVGTKAEAVPPSLRHARCLGREEVAAIGNEAFRVADALGAPQYIEWTLGRDGLHLLQCRPITALPPAPDSGGPRLVFDNSNIQESYCGVTTPLTFSFAAAAYAAVYEQTARVLGVSEARIASLRPTYRNLLGIVKGRIYYNINNWYRALLVFPSFGRNKADMERMMGLDRPVDFVEDDVLTWDEKLRRLPGLLRTLLRLRLRFARLEASVQGWVGDFDRACARVGRKSLGGAGLARLMEVRQDLWRDLLERWHVPILNDLYVMTTMGRLQRFVAARGRPDADAVVNTLLGSVLGLESLEPTRRLLEMARRARENPALSAALRAGPPLEALAHARQQDKEFAAAFDTYLERYGDRCMGELKLETVSLREDPAFAVEVLRGYLDDPEIDADTLAARDPARRGEADKALLLGPWGRFRLRRLLRAARAAVRNRESMRLARSRVFGLHRDIYRAIGARFHEAGRLDAPGDVFHLTVDEITAYYEGRAVSADLATLARARKIEYAAYEDQPMPNRFETRGAVYHGNPYEDPGRSPVDEGSTALHGVGCQPGVVEAPVRIIRSPRDKLSLSGCILVAIRTDPGWTPLFPTARGILVERGSTLSHTAVVARELGIPTVVGIPGLLEILNDGERVRMDGATGRVERLGPGAA